MTVKALVTAALEAAWAAHETGGGSGDPSPVADAVGVIVDLDSAPNRQMLLALAAGAALDPSANPAALQLPAGVDRRSQAKSAGDALTEFRQVRGLSLKISQDAGVSNQWRESELDSDWVGRRRPRDRAWAGAFLDLVEWLAAATGEERRGRATRLLDETAAQILALALSSTLVYPRFRATSRLAMRLAREFMDAAPDRPDALEALMTSAARVLATGLGGGITVERGDINSPDAIDVLILGDDGVRSGIEITDDVISLSKLETEVVPAMLLHGLDRATVVSRGVPKQEAAAIDALIDRTYSLFGHRIDLVTVDEIEAWLNFPGTSPSLATDFLWTVGEELDAHSNTGNRHAWFGVLTRYVAQAHAADPS